MGQTTNRGGRGGRPTLAQIGGHIARQVREARELAAEKLRLCTDKAHVDHSKSGETDALVMYKICIRAFTEAVIRGETKVSATVYEQPLAKNERSRMFPFVSNSVGRLLVRDGFKVGAKTVDDVVHSAGRPVIIYKIIVDLAW